MKIRTLILTAALTLPLGAQGPIPDTPAGRQFARWLEVFNRGERTALKEYLDKYHAEGASRLDSSLRFRESTGGFDLKKIETSSPTHLAGIVKERDSSQYARFELEVEPSEPHRIKKFGLEAIPRPAETPPPVRLGEAEALRALRVQIETEVAGDRFAGALLVARNGEPVFSGAWGPADRDQKTPNRLDTRFRIGSMNKMFTAVAVAQLAQAGKLKFTDTLGQHLRDYPNKDLAAKVTIHHLLTHTGGTGDIFGPEFRDKRLQLRELKDYVDLYGKRGLEFAPGSRWAYSNYGFLLLGVVVERVSGQSYYDYVREHIFKPAAMTRTDSLPESEDVLGRSIGYTRMGSDGWRPNTDTLPWRATSAGGVRWFRHGGGAPGMNGALHTRPASGYVLSVLATLDPPAASRLADFLSERLPAN